MKLVNLPLIRYKKILFLAILVIILLYGIFYWIHWLSKNDYITYVNKDGFSPVIPNLLEYGPYKSPLSSNQKNNLYGFFPTYPNIIENYQDIGSSSTSHTINLPLTTTQDCSNKCINARCSYTGQQCLSDIDCPGCNGLKGLENVNQSTPNVPGNDENGTLTTRFAPNYSTLTTNTGVMNASIFNMKNLGLASPPANFGPELYKPGMDYDKKRFDKRYQPNGFPFELTYPKTPTTTGLFMDSGPLPSNYFE